MVSCPKYAPLDFRLRSTDPLACCNQLVVRGATINARKTDKQAMTNFSWYKVAADISPFFFLDEAEVDRTNNADQRDNVLRY